MNWLTVLKDVSIILSGVSAFTVMYLAMMSYMVEDDA